jgi:hypothetical protein
MGFRRGDGKGDNHPRPGHPEPNLVRVRSAAGPGLINCNGFQNPGLLAFRRALADLPHRVPLIASVAGESVDDYLALIEGLAPAADLVENISSPNTALVYAWNTQPRALRALLEAARRACPRPLIVKLSPDFAEVNEAEVIPAALEAGLRIVNYGNTRRVDDPRLSQRTGGLSGPDLFPATLANLRRTRVRFGDALEVIATGGVDADKALAPLERAPRPSATSPLRHRGPSARQIWGSPRRPESPDSRARAPHPAGVITGRGPGCGLGRIGLAALRWLPTGCPLVHHRPHRADSTALARSPASVPQKRRRHRQPQVGGRKSAMARGRAASEARRARI